MPFTFSHPAIVLPLCYLPRRWFSLTGLVIGSMCPDFEYFITMKVGSQLSHTWFGIFLFNLPLGILLAFVFHNIVRNSLVTNLPFFLSSRLLAFTGFNWNSYFKHNTVAVITSVVIGAASHIFWDGFTHRQGFIQHFHPLQYDFTLASFNVPVYKILQHLSTLLGGFFIALAVYRLPVKSSVNKVNHGYWVVVVFVVMVVMTIRYLVSRDFMVMGNFIVSVITSLMVGVVVAPLISVYIQYHTMVTNKNK